MGQREVYEAMKSKGWLLSKEISNILKVKLGTGSLSRNLLKLRQVGMVRIKLVERNTFKYMAV